MKIIFLSDSLIKGGRERRMIELIKGLVQHPDIDVELILFKDLIEYPEIHDLGIPLHIIERKPKKNPLTFLRVYRLCRKLKPDVLHAWSSMSAIFAIPTKIILKIKLLNGNIASAPADLSIWNKEMFRAKLTYPFSDLVVGNSQAGLNVFKAPKTKSICVPNGFDFNRVNNIEDAELIRAKYNLDNNLIVGKVAAFADRKDYETFIAGALQVLQTREDLYFMAVGHGPNFKKIVASVPKQFRSNFVFTGPLRNVEAIINIFDIGVLSTNTAIHREGISNSIMEYMALGKPVIATMGGGTNEIIVDEETGFLIPPKSPEILADRILELLNDPDKASQMGKAGKYRIENLYSLESMTLRYLGLYRKLAGGNLE